MGCLGMGAVAAGLVLGKLRARLGLERLVAVGCLVFALVMVVAAFVRIPIVVFVALAIGGAAWMAVMATFNTATQSSAPPWVRSRVVALHTVSALGSFAIGSAFWGAVSGLAGLPTGAQHRRSGDDGWHSSGSRFPLRMGDAQEITPVALWEETFIKEQPLPDDGPSRWRWCYRIRAGEAEEFLHAVSQLRASRRRDGATLWRCTAT
jgi:MFS family permease